MLGVDQKNNDQNGHRDHISFRFHELKLVRAADHSKAIECEYHLHPRGTLDNRVAVYAYELAHTVRGVGQHNVQIEQELNEQDRVGQR